LDIHKARPRPVGSTKPEIVNGVRWLAVVDDAKIECGTKARFGSLLVQSVPNDTLVYVQPRCGFAGVSLTALCKMYNKKLVLFMPASKEVSNHQRWCIEQGAEAHFVRVAAMPNLNRIAKAWAEENGHFFIPFGLKHPLVVACGVRTAYDMTYKLWGGHEPREVWSVVSTGVLTRSLQIGWPNSQFNAIAVARNMKAGELGRADVFSHLQPFLDDAHFMPPFESASNYDAKAWEHMVKFASDGSVFWNVAGNIFAWSNQKSLRIDSQVEWGHDPKVFKL
jgi:hypothetical protein